jgi:hypothetical protein
MWMLREAEKRGVRRLRFLSRDGQVLHELARRIAPALGIDLDLGYAYSSRLTWSLAATNPGQLPRADWLFNSFVKSNAADVCARLGLPAGDFRGELLAAGASPDPDSRADDPAQAAALRRFLATPQVTRAAATRISQMRQLVTDYADQERLAETGTALIDAGWTGRMAGALVQVCEQAGMTRPHILFWGHEPRTTGWTDSRRIAAYMYNTATGHGMNWRIRDAPFAVETFCMADHGIVTGYHRTTQAGIGPVLASQANPPALALGTAIVPAHPLRLLRESDLNRADPPRRHQGSDLAGHGCLLVPPHPCRSPSLGQLPLRQRPRRHRDPTASPTAHHRKRPMPTRRPRLDRRIPRPEH